MKKLAALFGFGPSAVQEVTPPVFFYLAAGAVGYYSAYILEFGARYLGAYAPYLRIPGIVCSLIVAHEIYRIVVHRDGHSWLGWIIRLLTVKK